MSGTGISRTDLLGLAAGIVLLVAILLVLETVGVPRPFGIAFSGFLLVFGWTYACFGAGTTRAGQFFFADHQAGSGAIALALAASSTLPPVLLAATGLVFSDTGRFVALAAAMTSGIALSAILAMRQVRRGRSASFAQLVAARYHSAMAARTLAILIAITGLILAAAGLAAGSLVAGWYLRIGENAALVLVTGMAAFAAILGGATSLIRFAALAAILLLAAINLPLLVQTIAYHGFPLGHLSFGTSALEPVLELEDQLRSAGFATLSVADGGPFAAPAMADGWFVVLCIVLALGTAFLPGAFMLQGAARNPEDPPAIASNALAILAFLMASLLALVSFTKLSVYESVLGVSTEDARFSAPVLYQWSSHEPALITLCGSVPASRDLVSSACGEADHIISVSDLSINGALALAALPDLAGLPFAFTAFGAIALIAVFAGFAAISAFAAATNLAGSMYGVRRGHVSSYLMFLARLLTLLLLVAAALSVAHLPADWFRATIAALGLAASCIMPATLAMLYASRSTGEGVVAGAIAGALAALGYGFAALLGADLVPASGDEWSLVFSWGLGALPAELGAVLGIPSAFLVQTATNLAIGRRDHSAGAAYARHLFLADGDENEAVETMHADIEAAVEDGRA